MTTPLRRLRAPLVAPAVLALVLAAGSAGAASPAPTGNPSAAPSTPSSEPSASAEPNPGASDTTGSSPDGEAPIDPGDGIGNGNPGGGPAGPGTPELVTPKPGQQMVQPLGAAALDARVEGRHVVVNARVWSGVEPCSVLDSIDVQRSGQTIDITLLVGTSDPDAMCIAIAVEKVVVVDLGELDPGTYTITSERGDAEPISVEVG